MPPCELCGREASLQPASVEGVEVDLCNDCIHYGTPLKEAPAQTLILPRYGDTIEYITEDYAQLIKNSREAQGLTQQELSNTLSVKESLLQKIEQGRLEPDFELAKKLERAFSIKLIHKALNEHIKHQSSKKGLTLGDMIKKK